MDRALQRACAYPHPAGHVVRIETHISVIYLAGRYAYKVCKPVNLGFVDFTGPDARYRSCREALRLNRRLSPSLYLGVVPIVRVGRTVKLGARGEPFDHALKMRRFDERDTLSALLARNELRDADIDRTAARLASFHMGASRHIPGATLGCADEVRRQLENVLTSLEHEAPFAIPRDVSGWCREEMHRLEAHIDRRRAEGFVRECHGDLHLDNMVRRDGKIEIFDCIEFSEALRWIDVTADIAFVVMDLLSRQRGDLATHFLNHWTTATGDFLGLAALRLYVVYRALVRLLVVTLKHRGGPLGRIDISAVGNYLRVAKRLVTRPTTFLILCHGFSGSGKSVASQALALHVGAIRISSDIERKRTAGSLTSPKAPGTAPCAYTLDAIDANYLRLHEIAAMLLSTGYPVIVDASFLKRSYRSSFIELATTHSIPVFIVDFRADTGVLLERLNKRKTRSGEPSDADESILRRQLTESDPLASDERAPVVSIDTDVCLDCLERQTFWHPLLERLGHSPGWLADLRDA